MTTKLVLLAVIILLVLFSAMFLKSKNMLNAYRLVSMLSVIFTFGSLVIIIGYVILRGIPHFKLSMFSLNYTSDNVSMFPAIVTTVIVVFLSIILATPIGVFTAIYLVEYAKKGSKIVEVIRLAAETLQGIPSIVYGLFGMLFFGIALKFGYSILSGVCTVSIMILPLIIRSTEESLKSVNDSIRHASFALGAGRLRTIFRVVLPIAMPGILSGVILATGRIIGETACLIYTLGTATELPRSIMSSSRTLSLHMYMLSSEGLHIGEAYSTAMVLLTVVLIINYASKKIADKFVEVTS
ncbi:MAG: phosphate ABC transporter permease PstA [Peptoniphilaceae bacterium]